MKTRHDLILCLPTIACFHFAAPSSGELNLATIFGENMILQREMPVPIWGIGAPGEKIFMTFAGQEKSVIAGPSGEWLIRLNPMPASNKQREMVVSCPGVKTRPIVLKGVLVGDVWLVLMNGGSDRLENVGFGLPHPVNRYTAMDFRGQKPDSRPQKKYGKQRAWVPSGHKWGNDGLSYFFSQRLHRELDVPIGVIRLLTGNLDSIIPRSGLRAVPELEEQSDTVESRFPSTPKGRKVFGAWLQDAKAWAGKMRQSFEQNQEVVPSLPPVAPSSADLNWSTPTVVYNTVINPLVPFGVRGVVMSSADTNSDDSLYVQKIKALQIGLSEEFGQPELPLCFTQRGLSNFYSLDSLATDLDLDAWAGHRDRQRRAAAATGSGLVVTLDVDSQPREVGQRIAEWALAAVYRKGKRAGFPVYRKLQVAGQKVLIGFDDAEDGLMAGRKPLGRHAVEDKTGLLRFFAVAGQDRTWHSAHARIEGKRVAVWSDEVLEPVAVRYANSIAPRGINLYSRDGIPVSPFCTDDWPQQTFGQLYDKHFKQRSQDLMRRFGYPGEIESLAVAKVLAEKGKYLLTDVKLLLSHRNPDIRCGALRTLGYMFWHGTVTTRRYRSIPPQELDQTGLEVVTLICALSNDRSFWVRYCVAESLGMIGAVNQEIVKTLVKLAGDPDPMVCAAALKTTKFRNQEDDSNVRILNATIKHCPLTTYANGNFAGLLFSRYFRRTDVDWELMSGYLKQHDAGMAGPGLWHPMRACEYRISSNRADVYRILPGLLHVYSMGWLRSRLESRLFRNLIAEKPEPFEQKALQLQKEIRNLEKQKPIGWEDRMLRYQTAIEGINRLLQKNRSRKN